MRIVFQIFLWYRPLFVPLVFVDGQDFLTEPSEKVISTFANETLEIVHDALALVLTRVGMALISGSLTLAT